MSLIPALALLLLLLAGGGVRGALAQAGHHADSALGTVELTVSCSAAAQTEFNRAVALLHHMTYPRARESFERVATLDPRCAMAHWGIAMTLFQPLWPTRPGPADLRRGWEAVQRARSLQPRTQRERLFVDAAAAFFEPDSLDYWQRIGRWEQAMQRAHAALPQDPEVMAFYALAHLATTPADRVSRAHADRAASLLLQIYERNPDHPGAMHYLVHANDVPGREHESLTIVDAYGEAAPRNPHALHMPTHIYTRLGNWDGVIRGNLDAADAALAHPAGDQGQFVWDEFPHAIEYVVYAYLQMGKDDSALAQLQRLTSTTRLEPSFKTAFHLASTRARYSLERRAWGDAMSLPVRDPSSLDWDRFKWPEAITWFARGLSAAHEGRLEGAQSARARVAELETAAARAGEQLFARNIRVLLLEVDAWLAHARGDAQASASLMREAAELEVSTPKHAVTPGPTLPAHELLGDLLLEQGRTQQALVAFKRSLELYPRRFNSLLGAARAARSAGDEAQARAYYQQLLEVAGEGTRQPALDEARTFTTRD
ncbi:MAG TPA: tetratricopeptide repeat protein [Gemmatimonadaceae bacterium]|nr:tetratricopeptide repeat protein [Gemmatimonadaceae bacterium]